MGISVGFSCLGFSLIQGCLERGKEEKVKKNMVSDITV